MTMNKINNAELLNDAELENIAGGNGWETQRDADELRAIGCLRYRETVNKDQIDAAFCNLGLGIGTELHNGDKANKYYINHQKVSREEVWSYIHRYHRLDW